MEGKKRAEKAIRADKAKKTKMTKENPDKKNYDVVSVSRAGAPKRTNYIQDATQVSSKTSQGLGQFVKVFADVFLKHEAGKRSYF